MGAFSWLRPGRDHQLAATRYAGRESASDAAARKERDRIRPKPSRNAREAAAAGEAWETRDRRRFS